MPYLLDAVFYYGDASVQANCLSVSTPYMVHKCISSTTLHLRVGGGAFSPIKQFSLPELFFEHFIFFTPLDGTCLLLLFNDETPCIF